ncbi:hypothetical protein G4B88_002685 [Cannabis sativa]|uniref:WAT1-related protein n=1 Tax=Cannabis sativa TaxID=3483 RepID=A0A7J6DSZ7_CANSA|nr:hypothetical protein G4B88_002685 [Cannabis sativa]
MVKLSNFYETSKPYFAMISLQFGYAGMNIITKVSLNRGMSHYVLVVYRHAIATAVIAPFAIYFERKAQPKITFPVFMQLFILALLGPVIDQNFYYAGLKFTSPTFSCAMSNMLPAMTFVMAVLCGMEKVDMKRVRCQAKVVGTSVTVAGAMLMTLYKGPIVEMVWSRHIQPKESDVADTTAEKHWFLGSIFLIIATLAWASLFVLQNKALKTYKNHQLSLTTLVCLIGTIQAVAVTFVAEHKLSVWSIGWDMNLLAAAYAGIVTSSISYYVQGIVMKKRGPVVLGAVLIVIGLYSVLWGKHKEAIENNEEIPEAIKYHHNHVNVINGISVIEDIETNNNKLGDELKKGDQLLINNNKLIISSVAISLPIQDPSMKPNQLPKA